MYKHIEYVWRGIKTNLKPKNSTAPGPPPPHPVLKKKITGWFF